MNQREECCGQCPFSRDTPKEYLDTMGDNGERFIGQAYAGMYLPCHMEGGFKNCFTDLEIPQCAGAAKFRANVGGINTNKYIGKLEPDKESVFATAEELLAHHRGITEDHASDILAIITPRELARIETNSAKILIMGLDLEK